MMISSIDFGNQGWKRASRGWQIMQEYGSHSRQLRQVIFYGRWQNWRCHTNATIFGLFCERKGYLTTRSLVKKIRVIQNNGDKLSFMDDDKIDEAMLLPSSLVCFANGRFSHDPTLVRRRDLDSVIKPILISQDQILNLIYTIKHHKAHIIVFW